MIERSDGEAILDVIRANNCKRIAEIGVYEGQTTEFLLEREPSIEKYWAIDQWSTIGMNRQGKTFGAISIKEWSKKYRKLCSLMLKFEQLRVIRMTSLDAASFFPQFYFDLVFIDASHLYKDVVADIKAWFSLISEKGVISGHDYGVRRHKGVKWAVDEIFGEDNIKVLEGSVWVYGKGNE